MVPDPVLTLSDLKSRPFVGTSLAVLGWPIGHSLSPAMHNAALAWASERTPRFAAWRYHRFEIHPDQLPEALAELSKKRFLGVNLTVPHKILAFDLVSRIDPGAKLVGAVNTLKRGSDGWEGYNTDGYGLEMAVRESFGAGLAGRPVLLLGAGGAARGAAVECLSRRCASLTVSNRSAENLEALLRILRPMANGIPISTSVETAPPGTLVINATSAGLRASDSAPIELAQLPRPAAVLDMIYNPPRTPLLREAARLDIPNANGLSMLVHQGAKSLEIWTGTPAAETAPVMSRAAETALAASRSDD